MSNLYLAGKIAKNDFRHKLVPNLRDHKWDSGPINTESFSYVGPFFVSCDHGRTHGPNKHGAINDGCDADQTLTRQAVIANNNTGLDAADLLFAYITASDCYGTLIEIGWALKARTRVVLAFAPGILVDDFWYGAAQSASVYTGVRECCLPELIATELQKTKART